MRAVNTTPGADPAAARYLLLERATGLCGLLLVAVTFRLWLPQDLFPQVPLFGFATQLPGTLDYIALVAALLGLVSMGRLGTRRAAGLRWLCPLGFGLAVVLDQHRLQPWVYQISALAIIFSLCTAPRGLTLIRVLTVGIYSWSALGKFDFQFVYTVGSQMVETMVRQVGLPPDWLPESALRAAAISLPIGEAAVAILLLWPRTRRAGVVLAVTLHLTLILVLGPLGLQHEPGVLLWNAFFAIQAVLLFWPLQAEEAAAAEPRQPSSPVAGWLVALMLLLPALERFGSFDHWLSWALYAPHSSRATVYVTADAVEKLPPSLAALVAQSDREHEEPLGPWVRLPIDRWSLTTLGAPIYPQDRFQLGVALAISRHAALDRQIRVDLRSTAERFSGQRETEVLIGRPALQRAADRFSFSAKPRS